MAPVDTNAVLVELRKLMKENGVNAYIVPSGDAHQSEYIATCDERRGQISGFNGSAGTAVITEDKAALWTDGRYYLQASLQMDSNWVLMKESESTTPSQAEWLQEVLSKGSKVGVDPFMMSSEAYKKLGASLKLGDNNIVSVKNNLIDLIWTDQPSRPMGVVKSLELKFTGQTSESKVAAVRDCMKAKQATTLVLTALDEVAWLLNIRGSDISYCPVFFSYCIVTMSDVMLFIDECKVTDEVKAFLGVEAGNVKVFSYSNVTQKLSELVSADTGKVWIFSGSSQGLVGLVDETKQVSSLTPVALLKCIKNPVEIEGSRNAHIKDAVALCQFFSWCEQEVPKGGQTEISVSDKALAFREELDDYVGLSFGTISGYGPDGAIIHYGATPETDRPMGTDNTYLCDSGAQYLDGTTDVTRTMHFGTPTEYQQECFTTVLKGYVALNTLVFPNNVNGHRLECVARMALWELGLDYNHGTGHGVGAYLNVHEGPNSIHWRTKPEEIPLAENMIMSDEPGYYENGNFGLRIENVCVIKKANTKYNFENKGFLTFESLTLVPIQLKMILPELLSEKEKTWLNTYHQRVLDTIGPLLKSKGKEEAFEWLVKNTQKI